MSKKITISPLEINGERRIEVQPLLTIENLQLLQSIKDVQWDKEKKRWHVPYSAEAYHELKAKFDEIKIWKKGAVLTAQQNENRERYYGEMFQEASPTIHDYAKKLRDKTTTSEQKLWEALRKKQLDGHRFRRQHPCGRYIIDFYCAKQKLAIELDGQHHWTMENQAIYDQHRTEELYRVGIREIRFPNEMVLHHLDFVLKMIQQFL